MIVFERGFHGRTLLTLTMTDKVGNKAGFGPFASEVYRVPAPYEYRGITSDDSIAAIERLLKAEVDPQAVACAVLEPVQGEGGFVAMPPDFPALLRELLDRHGILYVDDEVQSGVGRTGEVWAIEHYGVEPDIVVGGKSLGGGLPLASVTGRAELMDSPPPGGLGGTFGGNPAACAAANAVLELLPGLLPRARQIGETARGPPSRLSRRRAPTSAASAPCSQSSSVSKPLIAQPPSSQQPEKQASSSSRAGSTET